LLRHQSAGHGDLLRGLQERSIHVGSEALRDDHPDR
jgi:hypothetical protein